MAAERANHSSSLASRWRVRRVLAVVVCSGLVALLGAPGTSVAANDDGVGGPQVVVTPAVRSDVSVLPLSEMTSASIVDVKVKKENKKNEIVLRGFFKRQQDPGRRQL